MFGKKEENKIDKSPVKKVRRKKKAEPAKPWGKLERLIIFIFLAGIPALSLMFLVHSDNLSGSKVLGDMVVSAPKDVNVLKEELSNEIKNKKETYGIWVQALDNSYSLGINESSQFDGASIFKLPLMIAYYKAVDVGTIDPNTNYTLKYSDEAAGAGVLASMPPGTNVTYKDIVNAMGKNSDNSAFSIMYNILPDGAETNTINKIGMKNTNFENSTTTPIDVGLIYYKLINSNLISETAKKDLFNSLTNTDYENLIPSGIPDNIRVIHKYGAYNNELNDAGIVFSSKPFILVILSKGANNNEAQTEIPKIANIVYNWGR